MMGVQILTLLIKTAGAIFVIACVARLLAQFAKADFYNPLAQTVVKITNPLLLPLRRIIPGFGGLDNASILLIFLGQFAVGTIIMFVTGSTSLSIADVAIWSLIAVLAIVMDVFFWGAIIVAISSWFTQGNYNPMLGFIAQIIEPYIRPFRRLNLQVGILDLSFLIAIMLLVILKDILLVQFAWMLGYNPNYSLFIGM